MFGISGKRTRFESRPLPFRQYSHAGTLAHSGRICTQYNSGTHTHAGPPNTVHPPFSKARATNANIIRPRLYHQQSTPHKYTYACIQICFSCRQLNSEESRASCAYQHPVHSRQTQRIIKVHPPRFVAWTNFICIDSSWACVCCVCVVIVFALLRGIWLRQSEITLLMGGRWGRVSKKKPHPEIAFAMPMPNDD